MTYGEMPVTFTPEQAAALGIDYNSLPPEQQVTQEQQASFYNYEPYYAPEPSQEDMTNYMSGGGESPVTYTLEQAAALGITPTDTVTQEEQASLYNPSPESGYVPDTRPETEVPADLRQDIPGGGADAGTANLSTQQIQQVESVPVSAGAYVSPDVLASGNTTEVINSLLNNNAPIATIQMYLTGQSKSWNDINYNTPTGQAIAARIPEINAQINNYNNLTGREQFDKAIALGFVPKDAQYVSLGEGKWSYNSRLIAEDNARIVKEYEQRSIDRAEAIATLAPYTTPDGIYVGEAAKAGMLYELLAAGYTLQQIKDEYAKITNAPLFPPYQPIPQRWTIGTVNKENLIPVHATNEKGIMGNIKNLGAFLLDAFYRLTPAQQTIQNEAVATQTYLSTGKSFGGFNLPEVRAGTPVGLQAIGVIPIVGSSSALVYRWSTLTPEQKQSAIASLAGETALTGMMITVTALAPKPDLTKLTTQEISNEVVAWRQTGFKPLGYEEWAARQAEWSAAQGTPLDMGTSAYNAYLKANAPVTAPVTIGEVVSKAQQSGFQGAAAAYGEKIVEQVFGQSMDDLVQLAQDTAQSRYTSFVGADGVTYKVIYPEGVETGLPKFDFVKYVDSLKQNLTGREAFVAASQGSSSVYVNPSTYESALHQLGLYDKIPTIPQTTTILQPTVGGLASVTFDSSFKPVYKGSFAVPIPEATLNSISIETNANRLAAPTITPVNEVLSVNTAIPAPKVNQIALPAPEAVEQLPAPIPNPVPLVVTVPNTIPAPETVVIPASLPSTIPATIPQNIPGTIPSTLPQTLPDVVPAPKPDVLPNPVPSPIPESSPAPVPVPPIIPIPPIIPGVAIPSSGGRGYLPGGGGSFPRDYGAITWKQGMYWWIVTYPYKTKKDVIITRTPPKGATIVNGVGSAYKTIQTLIGEPPTKLFLDMGAMDVEITAPSRKPGRPGAIKFHRDRHNLTSQQISLKGIRL